MATDRVRVKRRRRTKEPAYCLHKATGQAYSIWPAGMPDAGKYRYHGVHGTQESRENYRRWLLLLKCGDSLAAEDEQPLLNVCEVWEKWLVWIGQCGKYRDPTGRNTTTIHNYLSAMRYVTDLYGATLIRDVTPYAMGKVRRSMVQAHLSRSTINQYLGLIKRIWRFAALEGYIDRETLYAIDVVPPLGRNEGGSEKHRVLSVPDDRVQAVLAHVSSPIRAMIEVMCWSGCRPGEVRVMTTGDIRREDPYVPRDLEGTCWVFRPKRYKGEHRHGPPRVILLGPQAQAILEPWLRPWDPGGYLFLPYEAHLNAAQRRRRTKERYPRTNTMDRARPYALDSLRQAIRFACLKADVPHWHPHQLRHQAATRLAEAYGLETTRILLGHADVATTLQYVDPGVITADQREKYRTALEAVREGG